MLGSQVLRYRAHPNPGLDRDRPDSRALGANSRDRPRSTGRRDSIVEIILTVENIARVRFGPNLILSRERADGCGVGHVVVFWVADRSLSKPEDNDAWKRLPGYL